MMHRSTHFDDYFPCLGKKSADLPIINPDVAVVAHLHRSEIMMSRSEQ